MAEIPIYARIPVSVGEALAHTADNDFAIAMSNLVHARESEVGFDALTKPEQVVFCLDKLEQEVNNGGFDQYFRNSSGDHAGDTPAALRTLSAPLAAAIVERALGLFPNGRPPTDAGAREDQMDGWGDAQEKALSQLDAAFLAYPEPLAELERAYVQAQHEAFLPSARAGQSL